MSERPETAAAESTDCAAFTAGGVEVWPDRNLLAKGEAQIRLEPKVMALLCALAGAPGRVFSREELIEAVWGVEFGGDESLSRAASLLRKAFKDAGGEGEILETVPKRGYRLVAPVSGAAETAPADAPEPAPTATAPDNAVLEKSIAPMRWLAIAGALAALAIVIAAVPRFFAPAPADAEPSVAVIPFANLSPDEDEAYFALGLSDEIRATLSRIPDLRVSGRISSQNYGDGAATLPEISEALDVNYVLDGTVRSNGERVRIAAELLEARTGFEVWSHAYDHELTAENLFAIQSDIARAVAGALSIALDVERTDELLGARTDNMEAYTQFLRAQAAARKTVVLGPEALSYFRRAVAIDPGYGAAWAMLALAKGGQSYQTGETEEIQRLLKEGRAMAARAVAIDPDDADSRAVFAFYLWADGEWVAAAEEFDRALDLGRTSQTLLAYGHFLLRTGRLEEAVVAFRRGGELDPLNSAELSWEPYARIVQGHTEEAAPRMWELVGPLFDQSLLAYLEWFYAIDKNEPPADLREEFPKLAAITPSETAAFYLAIAERLDDPPAASALLREHYKAHFEAYNTAAEDLALIAGYLGDAELALEITELEAARNLTRLPYIWRPLLADMRKLDGFKDLMREIGLVEYWRAYEWPDRCRPIGAGDFECS